MLCRFERVLPNRVDSRLVYLDLDFHHAGRFTLQLLHCSQLVLMGWSV